MGLIAWEGFGIPIYTYGLVVFAAVVLGAACAWVTLRLRGERTAPLLDLLVYGLPVALVFARLGFVLHNASQYSSQISEIFCVWHGGLSFYGGMLGFFLTVLGYSLVHGVSAWHWLDLLVPAFIFAIVVYELGIFGMQNLHVTAATLSGLIGIALIVAGLANFFAVIGVSRVENTFKF